jgi:hypothetical protein
MMYVVRWRVCLGESDITESACRCVIAYQSSCFFPYGQRC